MSFDPMRRCRDCRLPSPYMPRCDFCAAGYCDCDVCARRSFSAAVVGWALLFGVLCIVIAGAIQHRTPVEEKAAPAPTGTASSSAPQRQEGAAP